MDTSMHFSNILVQFISVPLKRRFNCFICFVIWPRVVIYTKIFLKCLKVSKQSRSIWLYFSILQFLLFSVFVPKQEVSSITQIGVVFCYDNVRTKRLEQLTGASIILKVAIYFEAVRTQLAQIPQHSVKYRVVSPCVTAFLHSY